MYGEDRSVMEANLARQFKLSRQTAMMLALLVASPQVTSTMMRSKFGGTDQKVLVARLRAKLRETDVVVRNIPTMCYYLDDDVRARLQVIGGLERLTHRTGSGGCRE